MLTQPVSYWQAKVQLAVSKDTELENYLIEKNKIEVNADRLFIQALYLNAFWNKYKTNPKTAPPAVLKEALNNMDTYKLAPGMNEVLFEAISGKNKELTDSLAKEEQERKAAEEAKKEIERQEAEEKLRKEQEHKEKQKQEKEEQDRKEKERREKEEQKRKEKELKEKEKQERKEQERKEKQQKEKEEKELREKAQKEKEEKERKEQEHKEKERKEKEQEKQKEKREQKIKEEKERYKRAEERKLKEQEAQRNREEELKPFKNARNFLNKDAQWKIDSFVNCMDAYEKTPGKQEDYINGESEQIKFLIKILAFMEKHATELEGKILREVLEIIEERYNGSLKDASEDKDQDYTFVFKKEVIESEVIPQAAQEDSSEELKKKQFENKKTASNQPRIRPEVVAFMQACVSFGENNLNPSSLSTMFLLSCCAYTGGFFFHKVLNEQVAPVPQSFCYSAAIAGAFTPYSKDFYKQYQNHLAKSHFENAKKTLLATPTWDIELFTNVVDKLSKAKINAADNLTEKNIKIIFLKKVLMIYVTIQGHTSVPYARDNGLGILKQLEFIYGDLEKASEQDLLLGQDVFSSKKISEKGKRLNNFLMKKDGKISVSEELETAQGFIEKMKQGVGIDVIYGEIYSYSEKNKPLSLLKLSKQ